MIEITPSDIGPGATGGLEVSPADASGQPVVVHVAAGLAAHQGGPSYSVPSLALAQRQMGQSVQIRTVGSTNANRRDRLLPWSEHAPSYGLPGRALQASTSMRQALDRDAQTGALLHTHGLWLLPNLYPAWSRQRHGPQSRLVQSPRGMLAPEAMAISAWKKRPMWRLWQRDALAMADCLHATALSELEEIRAAGLRNPVAVIPNGMDLPSLTERPRAIGAAQELLSFGRIHPKKGLDRLVRAWAAVQSEYPDWRLRIVGPAERGHDDELRALVATLGAKRVSIEDAVYGEQKWAVYQSASVFVLPTRNENFGLTVAEALASNVPVISTRGAPWSGLVTERCGWWIDQGVDPLAQALRDALSLSDDERHAMGKRGRAWIERDFGWSAIARDMLSLYSWLRTGGDKPAFVHED